MDVLSWLWGIALGTALFAVVAPTPGSDLYNVDPRALATAWDKEHVSPPDPSALKHAELVDRLLACSRQFPETAQLEKAGVSTGGLEIFLLSLGTGPRRILLWSQMHGDEATATSALLDLAQYLGSHRQEPWVGEILEKFTLLCVPMLNPDGAERGQRRNAQGIDINRDARALQTPEGRLLKALRDRYEPFLGFNLHNQNSLTTVGDTGRVATIALLAVAADVPGGMQDRTPNAPASRLQLTRQVTAVLFEALSPFAYGHISRYDEDFNPRAFGDNLTLWGTPVVLIESGGNPAGQPLNFGVKLNFVGLLAVLNSLATGRIQNANPAVFDALKMNSDTPIYDLLLRNAWICTGTGIPIFRGDIAIRHELRGNGAGHSIIADIGDLEVFSAHQTVDCSGMMVSPGLIAWDPERDILGGGPEDRTYLQRGILTVLETGSWKEIEKRRPDVPKWRAETRQVNWGYIVAGAPSMPSAEQKLSLAEWLAAGARGWLADGAGGGDEVAAWFGIRPVGRTVADRFRVPAALRGDPSLGLKPWTSEAAAQFGLSKRGVIGVGAVPDLVLWTVPSPDAPPADLGACRPSRVILDGHLIDLSNPTPMGRFLSRP